MDRFSEEFPTYGNVDRDEDGYPEPPYRYPLECDNCSQTADRLTQSPDDDAFLVCDDCMEEIVRVNDKKREEEITRIQDRLVVLLAERRLKDVA
jgi:hypothetical protein